MCSAPAKAHGENTPRRRPWATETEEAEKTGQEVERQRPIPLTLEGDLRPLQRAHGLLVPEITANGAAILQSLYRPPRPTQNSWGGQRYAGAKISLLSYVSTRPALHAVATLRLVNCLLGKLSQ